MSAVATETPVRSAVEEAAATLRAGGLVVVTEGRRRPLATLVASAWHADAAALSFMDDETDGLLKLALTAQRCDELGLRAMGAVDVASASPPLTSSVTLRLGVAGISPVSRARTIRALVDPATTPGDLATPGHVFLVRGSREGLLGGQDAIEAAIELTRIAGAPPAAVVCPLLSPEGLPLAEAELGRFCERHGLPRIDLAEVVLHRLAVSPLVRREAEAMVPTRLGPFTGFGYRSLIDGAEHLALVRGDVAGRDDVVVGVHRKCVAGDVLHSLACDCRDRLEQSLATIETAGCGVLIYLSDRRDGIGPLVELHASVVRRGIERLTIQQILADLRVRGVRRA